MHSWKLRLFLVLLAAWPATAQMRTVTAVEADVDFKFSVGNRTFRPGHYEFIPKGPGLLAMRDSRARVVDTLLTRAIPTNPGPAKGRLVFQKRKGHIRLVSIWMENNAQALEVVGEEVVFPQFQPEPQFLPEMLEMQMRRDSMTPFTQRDRQ